MFNKKKTYRFIARNIYTTRLFEIIDEQSSREYGNCGPFETGYDFVIVKLSKKDMNKVSEKIKSENLGVRFGEL